MIAENWIVTGANGFVGRHVVRELARDSTVRIVGAGRANQARNDFFAEYVMLEPNSVEAWAAQFRRFAPAVVLHLAGRTPPADADTLARDNVELTRDILAALEMAGSPVRFVHCGSAAELGEVPLDRLPVDESFVPNPSTDYGRTKWEATRLVLNARAPIESVVGRIFNVIGPGQPANQVFGRFSQALAVPQMNPEQTWVVAGLTYRRDFVDVRDAARALITLGREGKTGCVYHIGRGVSRSVGEGMAILAQAAGIEGRFVEDQSAGKGPADSVADILRILQDTTWRPFISFEQSVTDLWQEVADRSEIARETGNR